MADYSIVIEELKKRWVGREELEVIRGNYNINDMLSVISANYPLAEEERPYIKVNGKKGKGKKLFFKIITKEDYEQWQYARNTGST